MIIDCFMPCLTVNKAKKIKKRLAYKIIDRQKLAKNVTWKTCRPSIKETKTNWKDNMESQQI